MQNIDTHVDPVFQDNGLTLPSRGIEEELKATKKGRMRSAHDDERRLRGSYCCKICMVREGCGGNLREYGGYVKTLQGESVKKNSCLSSDSHMKAPRRRASIYGCNPLLLVDFLEHTNQAVNVRESIMKTHPTE